MHAIAHANPASGALIRAHSILRHLALCLPLLQVRLILASTPCVAACTFRLPGYNSGDLQECMARLLRLHQFAEAAEGSESLTPLVFIKEKYAQECWLKASMQPTPQPGIVGAGGAAAGAAAPYAAGSVSLDGAVHHHGAAASSSQCTSLLPAAGCHDAVAPMEM